MPSSAPSILTARPTLLPTDTDELDTKHRGTTPNLREGRVALHAAPVGPSKEGGAVTGGDFLPWGLSSL